MQEVSWAVDSGVEETAVVMDHARNLYGPATLQEAEYARGGVVSKNLAQAVLGRFSRGGRETGLRLARLPALSRPAKREGLMY